jgi:predicted phage tail protein
MKRFRLARRCRLGIAGPCLAAFLAGWPAVLAAGIVTAGIVTAGIATLAVAGGPAASATGGPSARGSGPVLSVTLTAMLGPQASVPNPGPPTGLTATAGNGQVSLSWTAPASVVGGPAIIGYDVYMGTSSHGESATPVNRTLIGGTSYTVAGLTNGTTYYFTADAVNDAELHSVASNEASATPAPPATAPGAPTGLTATAGDAQVSLSWKAPASDGGAQITGYNIYQGTSSNITGKPVASTTGTSVTVKNLADGTTYFFKVTAVNRAGQGPASSTASATPVAAITNPGAPTGLTATPGNGQVTLSWTAPTSNGGAGITGYEIYQGTRPGGESSTPVSSTTGTSVTVTGLTNGTTYYFTVAAVNKAKRQGNRSGEASATPVLGTAPATAPNSAPASKPASAPASAPPVGGLTPGTPGGPTGLTATAGNAQVTLSWTAPATGTAPAPARYDVYEGTSPGFSPGTPVSSTTGTSVTVKGLTNGTTYYFVVTAVDSSGKVSGSSGEASAEPTGQAVLTAKTVPTPAIISLAAVAVVAAAAALTLAARRLRKRPRRPLAPPSDVRAVPEPGRPGPVSIHEIHEIGVDETYTVRIEPLPAEIITTLEEVGS